MSRLKIDTSTPSRKFTAFVVFFLVFALIGWALWNILPSSAGGAKSLAPITTDTLTLTAATVPKTTAVMAAPDQMHLPMDRQQWVIRYDLGWYHHMSTRFPYSPQFKLWFLTNAKVAFHAKHPSLGFSSTRQWSSFAGHATCSAHNRPTYYGPLDCTAGQGADPRLASRYYRQRRDLQDRWTLRVLYCGATFVVVYGTGGTAAGALGAGGGLCFAGFFVK